MDGNSFDDIVLDGGSVLHAETATFAPAQLHVTQGKVAIVEPRQAPTGANVLDVSGMLVTPGLVDLHAHVFAGQDLGLVADSIGPSSGTTTIIDAGSAGGHLFEAFRAVSVDASVTRVRAFLNISSIGTTSILLAGELSTLAYCDEDVAVACALRNRDVIVGVKVRASSNVAGENAFEAIRRGRHVADRLELPLMVHLGPAPATVDQILGLLRAGDVLTHCFTGFEGNQVVVDGAMRHSVREARERGVCFDVGHGASGFDAVVARAMIEQDAAPDTISSDLHAYSHDAIGRLTDVMSKLLALGMPLEQVFAATTIRPAQVVGLSGAGVGSLHEGGPGDVAVFEVVNERTEFRDGHGNTFYGSKRIVPVLTVTAGRIVFRRA